MRRAMVIAAAMALGACMPALNHRLATDPGSVARDPESPEIALLEYRLARHFAADPDIVTCAATRLPDDPPRFIEHGERLRALAPETERRLRARFPRLSAFAECRTDSDGARSADETRPAIVFDYHELTCETPTRCTAWVGFFRDRTANGWNFFEMKWDGYWRIREADLGIELTGADGSGHAKG